ncbi:MAG: DUF1549 domain-containing protein [Acidobacteria bacterium]|nr:DUF1549 domain-containing protein [Acidobacteriota bacterium]
MQIMFGKLRSAIALSFALCASMEGADPGCPRYPSAMRTELMDIVELDRAYQQFGAAARKSQVSSKLESAQFSNFIDQQLFAKMAADKVSPAAKSSDTEFLRRVYIDVTGRIPTPSAAKAFLESNDPDKRAKLIDQLVDSPAYADQLTTFWANKFKVTRSHESIGTLGRNTFYEWLRKSMADDRPYNDFARELIGAAGEVDTAPGTQFFARWMDVNGPIQDSWDDITDKITTTFLGYKTECISCHNGRAHLEKINLYLTRRTRSQFWQMSAFLSRLQFVRWSDDTIGFRPRVIVNDRNYGTYTGSVSPTNPGNRPLRINAKTEPVYMTTGEEPQSGNWRQEFGRMLTADRQFAKATVNHIWAYLFSHGIVDPPEAWDFERTDPLKPPPGDWPLQNSHPELLERLADFFIANNYQFKPLFRQILKSEAYQLSSTYQGKWDAAYVKYFARHEARRLSAEELYDSLTTATRTEQPMLAAGLDRVLWYANQLPDPNEPSTDFRVVDFMNNLGRGNWLTIERTSEATILGLLYSMNDSQNVNRTSGNSNAAVSSRSRIFEVDSLSPTDEEAIRQLFLATLSRYPSDQELSVALRYRNGARAQWLSDLQWALVNKLDFIFNR